jgi:protein-S-isoprenylcysteine O-methyltransferase Ste14
MSNEIILRVVAGTLGISVLPTLRYYWRNARGAEKRSRPGEGWAIWILVRFFGFLALVALLLSIFHPSGITWSRLELPIWLRYWAGGVGAMTVPLLYWVFHALGQNLSTDMGSQKGRRIVTEGPYRWVRHPLYSVGTVFWIALSLVLSNGAILLMSVLIFVLIVRRTRIEEAKLVEAFGERYRVYKTHTGRFIPRLKLLTPVQLRSHKAGSR